MRPDFPTLSGVRYTLAGDAKISRGARDSKPSNARGHVQFEDPRERSHSHPHRDEWVGELQDRSYYTLRHERVRDAQEHSYSLRHERVEDSRQRSQPLRYKREDEDPLPALSKLELHEQIRDVRNLVEGIGREVLRDAQNRLETIRREVHRSDSRDRSDLNHQRPRDATSEDFLDRPDLYYRLSREFVREVPDSSNPRRRLPGENAYPLLPGQIIEDPFYHNSDFLPPHPSLTAYTPLPYPPHLGHHHPRDPPDPRYSVDPIHAPPHRVPQDGRYSPTWNWHERGLREVEPVMPVAPEPLPLKSRFERMARYEEWERERWEEEEWERERERDRLEDRISGWPYEFNAGTNLLKERGVEYLRDARRGAL